MQEKQPLLALTGLRFVAASAVFFHHIGGKFGFNTNPYSIGALAVSFFFVLSGFILTYVYHDRLNSWVDVRRFWFTRFARIWPLHVICLVIAIGSMFSWTSFRDPDTWWKLILNLTLLHSWVPQSEWALSFNVVSWSISVEAFFYLVFPALFSSDGKHFLRRCLFLQLFVAATIVCVNWISHQQYFESIDFHRMGHVNPLFRIPEFCMGIVAGRVFLAKSNSARAPDSVGGRPWTATLTELASLVLVVFSAWLFWKFRITSHVAESSWGSTFLGSWIRVAWMAPMFAILIPLFARMEGLLSQLAASRLLVYLGEISYAFYMIHFLVIRQVYHASMSYGGLTGWAIASCCYAIAIGLSILLYELIEMPVKQTLLAAYRDGWRSLGRGYLSGSRRSVSGWTLLGAAVLVSVPITLLTGNTPNPSPTAQILRIVDSGNPALRNVDFGSSIRLLGCQAVQTEDGAVELNLVWTKRVNMTRDRLVLLLDANGKRIGRGSDSAGSFANAENGVPFKDSVRLPLGRLRQAESVILIFRGKGRGQSNLIVDNGPRIRRRRELILLTNPEIRQLLE